MHATAIVERTRLISRPASELLLLGGDAQLFEQLLAQAFNASWVVTDRGPILPRAIAGRTFTGSWARIPFADRHFGTVVAEAAWFDGLEAADVARAIAELERVSADTLLIVAGDSGPDPETARRWWESQLLELGWRRHSRFFAVLDFESLEDERELCLVMQRVPAEALRAHPLTALRAERDLHMDMLRETGRRSDAHLVRYEWARQWIKPGDVVVDAACGLGYGSAILWDGSEAARITGLDISESVIRYATSCFTEGRAGLTFRVANVEAWQGFEDHSVDCIISFETIEHLARPDLFVQGARRVLKPGGRFLCSIPNEWLDETGKDPNPFHLHVFNLERLADLVGASLLVDEAYAQSAGGHSGRFSPRRLLRNVSWPDVDQQVAPAAEWWLLSAVKDPVAHADVPYQESVFATATPAPNAIAFARDYVNPWAIQALVMGCHRVRSPKLLRELAARWLAASPEGSADAGASLCILAYRALAAGRNLDSLLLARMAAYRELESSNPQVRRWQVSLAFVEGLGRMRAGDSLAAEQILRWCASVDASSFSPHLETKTTEAAWLAGRLALERGDREAAAASWTAAFTALERLRATPVAEWLVTPERPSAFEAGDGLREIAQAIDNATLSANALRALNDPAGEWRPGAGLVDRNFQKNATRLVDVVHSRGGYIMLLRAEIEALQRSVSNAGTELGTAHEQLREARAEVSEATHRLGEADRAHEFLSNELRQSRDAEAAAAQSIATLNDDLFALRRHAELLQEQLNGKQTETLRLAAERAALRGALRRLMPRVIVIGAGDEGRRVWEALTRRGTADVVAIVDGDRRRQDRPFLGTIVRSVEWMNGRTFDAVALAGPAPREVKEKLKGLNIPADSIIQFPADAGEADLDRIAAEWFPDPLAAALAQRPQPQGHRLGIFGTGSGAMKVWEAVAELDSATVVWFADNNPKQQGQTFLWLDVIAPAAIAPGTYDAIVIGSMSVEPIRKQLLGLGIQAQRLLAPNVTGTIATIREELVSSLAALEEVSLS